MRDDTGIEYVVAKLAWLRSEGIWPNGLRYLWTDAFGVVLLVSLYHELQDARYLDEAEAVIAQVDAVLGRPRGIRIGEEPDRDGQYYHYLAKWLYALYVIGRFIPEYRERGIELAREIHAPFYVPGRGVIWKMREDLSGPYPGFGFGALDAFDGFLVYSLLGADELANEIADMRSLIADSAGDLVIHQDLGIGMMLWMCHFVPEADWAMLQKPRCLSMLDHMWTEDRYFCREPRAPSVKFAFTNYGIGLGLQAVGVHPERVRRLHAFFESYRSGDEYDRAAITHVMACVSHFPGFMLKNYGEAR